MIRFSAISRKNKSIPTRLFELRSNVLYNYAAKRGHILPLDIGSRLASYEITGLLGAGATAACLFMSVAAHAQSWQPPSDSQRCPSRWGAADERGSANHMGPETVLRAARLIKAGEVIELGHVLNSSIPLSAGRRFEVDLAVKPCLIVLSTEMRKSV